MKRVFGVCLLVFVMLLGAGSPQVFAGGTAYFPLRWSADSSQLLIDTVCTTEADEPPGIYLVDVADGQVSGRTLVADDTFHFSYWDVPSPFMSGTVGEGADGDLYWIDLETLSLRNLTSDVPNDIHSWTWSPDDQLIHISLYDFRRYVVNPASGEVYLLPTDIAGSAVHWSYQAYNSRFLGKTRDNEIYMLNIASGEMRLLTADVPPSNGWSLTPDGETLVVNTIDEQGDVYAVNIEGGEAHLLTADLPAVTMIYGQWLPGDRTTLVVNARDEEGRDLYALNIASGEVHNLTVNVPAVSNPWDVSSNGETVYARSLTDLDLYAVNIASGEAHNLTANLPPVEDWGLAPESSTILILTGEGEDSELYVLNAATSEIYNLTESIGVNIPFVIPNVYYTLLPDGSTLFVSQRGEHSPTPGWHSVGSMSIYIVPQGVNSLSVSLSPDGQFAAYEDCNAEFGIHLVSLADAPNLQD